MLPMRLFVHYTDARRADHSAAYGAAMTPASTAAVEWSLRRDKSRKWRLCSSDFTHDVELILTGDFADDNAAVDADLQAHKSRGEVPPSAPSPDAEALAGTLREAICPECDFAYLPQDKTPACEWCANRRTLLAALRSPAGDARDAERYRWLRNQHGMSAPQTMYVAGVPGHAMVGHFPSPQQVDAALDAALARPQGQEGG